jgi:hypothetical protein
MPQTSLADGRTADETLLAVGSDVHRWLFCHMLLDSFDPYRPAVIAWPILAPDALARLVGLPFWDIAVATEERAARRMEALADITRDPLIREAVALNAFEERRHKEVLGHMIRHYGIVLKDEEPFRGGDNPEWGFLRTGYGECFDSFFAFGLFALARQSGFFPEPLVEVFEPIVQEEARHNIFFVNWVAYTRTRRRWPARVRLDLRRLMALAIQASGRLSLARDVDDKNFTRTGGEAVGLKLKPGAFFALCAKEQGRRMARYDSRLLRPRIMPNVARMLSHVLPA